MRRGAVSAGRKEGRARFERFSPASLCLVASHYRYTDASVKSACAAVTELILVCFGSDCLQGSFSWEPMRKWRWQHQCGEERKYSGYKNQIFVSGLLPSCKCPPFGGLMVCVQLHQQDRPSECKGENRNGGSGDTMQSLSFTHACQSMTAQEYHHLHAQSRHEKDKYQNWQL